MFPDTRVRGHEPAFEQDGFENLGFGAVPGEDVRVAYLTRVLLEEEPESVGCLHEGQEVGCKGEVRDDSQEDLGRDGGKVGCWGWVECLRGISLCV